MVCPYLPLLWGAREEVTNEKTTFYKVCFFRGLPILASTSPMSGAREEVTNEKTTFYKAWFFRGLPILASMSPMRAAREEVTNEKTTFYKVWFFSWFAHTCLYVTHVGGKGGGNFFSISKLKSQLACAVMQSALYTVQAVNAVDSPLKSLRGGKPLQQREHP